MFRIKLLYNQFYSETSIALIGAKLLNTGELMKPILYKTHTDSKLLRIPYRILVNLLCNYSIITVEKGGEDNGKR